LSNNFVSIFDAKIEQKVSDEDEDAADGSNAYAQGAAAFAAALSSVGMVCLDL